MSRRGGGGCSPGRCALPPAAITSFPGQRLLPKKRLWLLQGQPHRLPQPVPIPSIFPALLLCEPGCRQRQAAARRASLRIKPYALKQGADKPLFHSGTVFICLLPAKRLPVLKIHPTQAPDPGFCLCNVLEASVNTQQRSTFFWRGLQELNEQYFISTNCPKV